MTQWTLIVNPSADVVSLLSGAVKAELPDAECVAATNIAQAEYELGRRGIALCRLIVCAPAAPMNGDESPALDARDLHGVEFVGRLRTMFGDEPPVIFPTAVADLERNAAIGEVRNSRAIEMKDLYWRLKREIAVLLHFDDPTVRHVDVEIFVRSSQPSMWTMRGSGGYPLEDHGPIDFSHADLEVLTALCGPAAYADAKFLRILGNLVYGALMNPAKSALEAGLERGLRPLGGMEYARIRFNVDEKTHGILLETLAKPSTDGARADFLMMRTPMFRKLGGQGGRYPLFQDPGRRNEPVNCLLIQGCVNEFNGIPPLSRRFNALPSAEAEIDWLHAFLQANKAEFGIGQIELLRYGEHEGTFAQSIDRALARTQFQMIHYAGHSALDSDLRPWLVFGRHDDDLVDAAQFAVWAREVRFVFMSSCESANSQVIYQLVERDVPAVVGYSWPVQDRIALEFARTFYSKLFGDGPHRRLLDYSFMTAKRALHTLCPQQAHWAAPLLFMQVLDGATGGADGRQPMREGSR
jgi:hypothetical protein